MQVVGLAVAMGGLILLFKLHVQVFSIDRKDDFFFFSFSFTISPLFLRLVMLIMVIRSRGCRDIQTLDSMINIHVFISKTSNPELLSLFFFFFFDGKKRCLRR